MNSPAAYPAWSGGRPQLPKRGDSVSRARLAFAAAIQALREVIVFAASQAGARVRSALLANGIDPSKVPPSDLANVLRHLVKTGRGEEAASFISSMDASSQRNRLLGSHRGGDE